MSQNLYSPLITRPFDIFSIASPLLLDIVNQFAENNGMPPLPWY